MNGDCEYTHEGYDTDGTEFFRCVTHDEVEISSDAPCDGYVEIAYLEAEQRQARPDEWAALMLARRVRDMMATHDPKTCDQDTLLAVYDTDGASGVYVHVEHEHTDWEWTACDPCEAITPTWGDVCAVCWTARPIGPQDDVLSFGDPKGVRA